MQWLWWGGVEVTAQYHCVAAGFSAFHPCHHGLPLGSPSVWVVVIQVHIDHPHMHCKGIIIVSGSTALFGRQAQQHSLGGAKVPEDEHLMGFLHTYEPSGCTVAEEWNQKHIPVWMLGDCWSQAAACTPPTCLPSETDEVVV